MTREDLKKLFPEATDEQITKMLNMHNSELNIEKNKATALKDKADKADGLQEQINTLQQQLDDAKGADSTELQKALDKIAKLEKQAAVAAQKKSAMEKFKVTAEQVDKIIKEDGSLDYDALGQIISEKETAAATAKEQEIANNAGNPGGGNGGGGSNDTRTDAEKIAEGLFQNGSSFDSKVVSQYM